ncbi:MAG TPA: hypothetical protein DDZ96_08395 [Porphyromonadaceae bacterium]|jgi:hypothetical protein|nr:hypothetical protein [Porphyromonadaceae bacterium]
MNKATFFVLLTAAVIFTTNVKAQETNYLRLSVEPGMVLNTKKDGKFALGGSIGWLTQDNFMAQNENNYLSVTLKAVNNPYGDGKILSSILNDKDDAFNYGTLLIGYRFTQQGIENGFYVEPRIGGALGASYGAFVFSPAAGYAYDHFDFSLFLDAGFGSKNNAIGEKNFFNLGLSIGYNIGL